MRYPLYNRLRVYVLGTWAFVLVGAFYLFIFHARFFEADIHRIFLVVPAAGYALYLLLGCFRGFTLIPSTSLIVLGLLFFPPLPLFLLTIAGILVSSASVYYFSELLRLDELFERKHKKSLARVRSILQKNELAIVIAWSFFPLVPTDVICYVCGTLNVDVRKFLLGVLVGESVTCGIYIWGGTALIQWLHAAG